MVRAAGALQPARTTPWWISRPTASTGGTATKNSHDTGITASPNSSPTHGISRTALTSVNTVALRIRTAGDGRATPPGQASRTSSAVSAPRKASSARASTAKPSQERW